MKFAIIGCGHAGRRHADQFKRIPGAELVGCCDNSAQAAEQFARDYQTTAYTDIDSLLNLKLDGVTICTPPSTHIPIVASAIQRGIRVLCEKPLATNLDECLSLSQTDPLACAFKFRHLSGGAILRDMIRRGELGSILAIRGTAVSDLDMTGRWFSNRALSGGGVLFDNGVHLIDLCRFLVGDVDEVSATISGGKRKLDVEESATILLRMECGASVELFVSWEAPAPMPPLMEIYGTAGYAQLGYELKVFDANRKLIRQIPAEGVDIWHEVIANFAGFVSGQGQPSAVFEDGFNAVAVVEAAYRSTESGGWERPRSLEIAAS